MVKQPAKAYVPDRGDVVWLDFDPQSGHEQSGHRPALVVSPRRYNSLVGLALLCPISSNSKGYPFEVPITVSSAKKTKGVILADQIKSLDWRTRRASFICQAPPEVVADVLAKLQALL